MNFIDGDGGRKMLEQFSGKSTIDLIIEGKRTATSRDTSKKYNQYELKIGDIIEFYSGSKNVFVEITKEPYFVSTISAVEWSLLECWSVSVYKKLNKNYQQLQFKLIKNMNKEYSDKDKEIINQSFSDHISKQLYGDIEKEIIQHCLAIPLIKKIKKQIKEQLFLKKSNTEICIILDKIEPEIRNWNIDGTKTAGHLTRKIMEIIHSNIN